MAKKKAPPAKKPAMPMKKGMPKKGMPMKPMKGC